MHDRDVTNIHLVGAFALIMGVVLFLLTAVTSLFLLLNSPSSGSGAGSTLHAIASVVLALIMASALSGCGGELRRSRPDLGEGRENLRLVWTALLLVMVLCAVAGLWLVPPLAALAGLTLLALIAIRPSVIRVTG